MTTNNRNTPDEPTHTAPGGPSLGNQLASYIGIGESESIDAEPPIELLAGERVTWTRTQTSLWPALVAVVMAIVGVVVFVVGLPSARGISGLVLALAGLAILVFSRIQVHADATGVRVRFGMLPWPTKFVAIDDIAHAGVIDLRPTEWGGWGYRIARPAKGFSRSAVVLRGGEALHLTQRNGREFAVTVDDAAQAAAVVNAYVAKPVESD